MSSRYYSQLNMEISVRVRLRGQAFSFLGLKTLQNYRFEFSLNFVKTQYLYTIFLQHMAD
ncbi:hypothetical protein M6B38_265390 [Iris pallida]|uniref:Uncharacterized protein n=1 Tax=Iris pallida TaxID=29817 RepID=A0AAX6HHM7_IRIPA|nr:hypothetical protein M6B38_312300 [Iris pallida]KAJ6850254.1 hypothetical protein M6B38_265390 [Iris pallida]